MKALIQFEDLHYRPPTNGKDSVEILRGIDLTIEEGSFVAIIGKNGSGKTTLINHINGLLLPSHGRVLVNGLDTRLPENRTKLQSMVGMVFQNPADQIVASTVEEDIAFGLENINLPTAEIQTRVKAQLTSAGLLDEASRPPHLLSGGQIQMVALAGVLARCPRVILLDEPTSMLDPLTRQSFLQRLFELRNTGMTIVYVTHHMEETLDADQVVVMQTGKIAFTGSPEEVFYGDRKLYEIGLDKPEVVKFTEKFLTFGWALPTAILSSQSLLRALPFYSGSGVIDQQNKTTTPPLEAKSLINVENLHYTYLSDSPLAHQALNGANFKVYAGSIHAVAGANGSGKSTLLQHINGILRPTLGQVRVGNMHLENPQTSLRDVVRKVGIVFQNPEAQFFEEFVGDEIAYGPKQLDLGDLRARVQIAMEMVGLEFETFKDRRLMTLSGGEKRKVALASTLVLDQDIVMFDEPTAGMDPLARDDLLALFKTLRRNGKTIIIASHRMDELAEVADQLSLMQSGLVSHTGPFGDLITNASAIKAAGLSPPFSVAIAQALIAKNWPIVAEQNFMLAQLLSSIEGWIR